MLVLVNFADVMLPAFRTSELLDHHFRLAAGDRNRNRSALLLFGLALPLAIVDLSALLRLRIGDLDH
jgi:hypothetical protein